MDKCLSIILIFLVVSIHNVINKGEEKKGQSIKARGKHKGQTSKLMRAITESKYWVVMSNTKTQ